MQALNISIPLTQFLVGGLCLNSHALGYKTLEEACAAANGFANTLDQDLRNKPAGGKKDFEVGLVITVLNFDQVIDYLSLDTDFDDAESAAKKFQELFAKIQAIAPQTGATLEEGRIRFSLHLYDRRHVAPENRTTF